MIFTFNNSVRQGDLVLLSKCILLIAEKHHHLQLEKGMLDWLSATILDSQQYLGLLDREALKKNSEVWRITGVQKEYQTKLTVGIEADTISIEQLYKIVNEPSYVVIENSKYDWAAICRWVEIYRYERDFKSLNEFVLRAINEKSIRGDHAGGGNGTIVNKIKSVAEIFPGCANLKVTTIFDSDKEGPQDHIDHNKALKDFLSSSAFTGYELHKREIENYYSIETFRMAGMIMSEDIPDYTPEDYDFIDIEKASFVNYKKRMLQNLTNHLYRDALKKRVAHHKVSDTVDEIQLIIITLARFI